MDIFYGVLIGIGCSILIQNILVLIWAFQDENDGLLAEIMYYTSILCVINLLTGLIFKMRRRLYQILYKNNDVLVYNNENHLPCRINRQVAKNMIAKTVEEHKKQNWNYHEVISWLHYGFTGYGSNVEPFRNSKHNHAYWKRKAFLTQDFQYCPNRLLKKFEKFEGEKNEQNNN